MLVDNWDKENIGFEDKQFPPEKSIYLTLLRETGIHRPYKESYILGEPLDENIQQLWIECDLFLQSAKEERKSLSVLVEKLLKKPFKLKKGLIDFWLPIFLFIKRDDYALFSKELYIPTINDEVLELVASEPSDFDIKTFNIDGVKLELFNQYRSILNLSKEKVPTNKVFIETIRPFLNFYKGLPEYSKKTQRLKKETLRLRDAIAHSKEPEKSFFVDFPEALGFDVSKLRRDPSQMSEYVKNLQSDIKELRSCFDFMVVRFEDYIKKNVIGQPLKFPDYKISLQNRYNNIKSHLLRQNQQVFYGRLSSALDDRVSWLDSIAHACIGKSLSAFDDIDETRLYDKFNQMIYELDNLTDINEQDVDIVNEDVYKLEITSFMEGLNKSLIRLPKNKQIEVSQLQRKLEDTLGTDRLLNIATLAKILQKQIQNEQ